VVARRLRSTPATRLVDRFSLPVVRRFANGVAGAALVATTLANPAPAGARAAPAAPSSASGAVVTMYDIGPSPTSALAVPSPTPVTMRALDQEAPPAAAGHPRSTWVVAPGDTLWHVAERLVTARTGRRADPAAILDELDRLVAANTDRLVVPGNPDLVFPGQELLLP
jgi:nucleoid-associated protein YgaU